MRNDAAATGDADLRGRIPDPGNNTLPATTASATAAATPDDDVP